jgi:voltage-gated potassium channel
MFYLSLSFLVLTAAAIRRFQSPDLSDNEVRIFLWLYLALWMPFLGECALHLRLAGRPLPREYGRAAALCLLPPLRMAARRWTDRTQVWLPGLVWQTVDRNLRRRLERAFSVPMIVIALLILPVLGLDFALAEQMGDSPVLGAALDLGTGVIWLAFAGEFIIMVSVADRKLRYCRQHWLDLAIILLPLIAFLRSLRLLRVARLARATRIYRLRGILTRASRAVVLLDLVQRVLYRDPRKRLRHLRELLVEKKLEMQELRERIRLVESQLPHSAERAGASVDGSCAANGRRRKA